MRAWWLMATVIKTGLQEEGTVMQLVVVALRWANIKLAPITPEILVTPTSYMASTILTTMLLNELLFYMHIVVCQKKK